MLALRDMSAAMDTINNDE